MTTPFLGIDFEKLNTDPKAIIGSDMSVIGLIGTGPAANATSYPLNTPVQIFSNDATALSDLGLTGTLADAVTLINAQLTDGQLAAKIVVVRVTVGADDDATMVNIIGSQAANTGLFAFMAAPAILGIVPRLIIAPGYTWQTKIGLSTPIVAAAGTGGANGTFALSFVGGTGSGATGTFTVTAGSVTAVTLTNPGVYTVAPTISLTASAGLTGASVTTSITTLANPVCAALPAVLGALFAHAIVDGPATTLAAFTAWRNTMNSDRIIAQETAVRVGVGAIQKWASPAVAGIAVRVDYGNDGIPSKSWANQPMYGIVGPSRAIAYSLNEGATEGQQILSLGGGVILRGEAGVETAIASSGFQYVNIYSTTTDTTWQQYHQTRMRDYQHLAFLKTLRAFLGFPLIGQTLQAIYNTMHSFERDLQAGGHILGFRISFPPSTNSAEQLRTGRINILFQAEEAPVVRLIHIQSARYRPALDTLLVNLQAQLGTFV